jgi:hypothetical protein
MINIFNNPNFKKYYFLFVECVISVTVFFIFFSIFMNVYYVDTELSIILDNFANQLQSYNFANIFSEKNIYNDAMKKDYNKLIKNNTSPNTSPNNKMYISTVISMSILGLCYILIAIPIIMGKIQIKEFDFIQILFAFILHFILIVSLEAILIFIIFKKYTFIKSYITFI